MPEHETLGLGEDGGRVDEPELLAHVVDRPVVEEDERAVEARDHHVLVAAGIGDDRGPVAVAREILEDPAALDAQLRLILDLVELRRHERSLPVDRVEVEGGDAGIRRGRGIRWHPERRPAVEGHVEVHELAEEGRARGVRRVVGIGRRVVAVHRGIRDEGDRTGADRIFRVEEPTRLADVAHDVAELIGRARRPEPVEERREVREHPREVARHDLREAQLGPAKADARGHARRAGGADPKTEARQEGPPSVLARSRPTRCHGRLLLRRRPFPGPPAR